MVDLKLNNVDIEILNGNCEDAINIIRSEGLVNSLYAQNSSNDAHLAVVFLQLPTANLDLD